ncbi:TrmH family RNA methyltransferase [Nocardioides zeae]|uniref:TrmH family RNA methyltransferase n=1 Tax=Nocardioides zeae TaxID=1457234 RepID=A0ACC6IN57_9ACTN|nr:RNA methyltransferase [Nocardioides zeae]MDR6176053.1 TrmH family RNA methyltransferase [Nocardioides zeae]MDR6212103.1 TrmH family RNA methyltransferase [Nocardioides zeae]
MRTERRLFVVDGPKGLEAALETPGRVREVFVTPAAAERYGALLTTLARTAPAVPVHRVDGPAMEALSDAVTPAGVVAVCTPLDVPLAELLAPGPRLVALCADVRDPGNAGTVVRCADAAGADGVALLGNAVDLHNPKTVRASVGSVFHLPIAVETDVAGAVAAVRAAGLRVLAADGGGRLDLFEAEASGLLAEPTAWLLGNEAWGLPGEVAALADDVVSIPIHGRAESLNLATAAALCLYASARAQRAAGAAAPRP